MLVIFWILCGIFASAVADNKGHNGCMWALGGFLLGPLALLATLGLGDRKAQKKQDDLLEETRKQNNWMRRKMYEAEEERRYYEEQRYRQRLRQLPQQEYYDENEEAGYYDDERYEDDYVDVGVSRDEETTETDNERGTEKGPETPKYNKEGE